MNKLRYRILAGMLLALGAWAALAAAQVPEIAGNGGEALAGAPGQASGSAAAAFKLNVRILEGLREGTPAPAKPVTSSYLKFMNFSNYELEEDIKADQQIKNVYGLEDLGLIAAADLAWEKGKNDKALYMFRLNGQEFLLIVTPGRLPEKNRFRIEVHEQSADRRANLLDTEFSLPEKTAAVFGFENTERKPYFITLRVARWVGGPAAAAAAPAGGTAGGAAGDVIKAGRDKVKPPKLIKKVEPVYPEEASKAGVVGVVIMEATTDTYGRVVAVKVLRSVPLLDQAAIDALRQWVYEPMVIDGKPHPVVFTVTMQFKLDDKKKPQVEGGVAGGQDLKKLEKDAVRVADKFAEGAVKAEGDVEPPKLIKEVMPVYPEAARAAGVMGVVILSVRTDETGKVADTMVLRSIPLLDQAAIDAVKQWVYEPFVKDGQAQPIVFTVTVPFQLK